MTASLELTRSILDPVHGLIRLTPEELKVIDHPLFQRLRNIRQNGLLYMVFPSATHTRFEHSIGTLFVAHSMLDALLHNSRVAASKNPAGVVLRDNAKQGEAFDFSKLDQRGLSAVFRITRLAALVHDLGHGPLSHTFDTFAPTLETVRGLLQDPRVKAIRALESILSTLGNGNGRIEHEAVSCLLFATIWGEADPVIPMAVSAAILGEKATSLVATELRPWTTLAHDLIASAPADADRMDYLERDSRSLGVTYGLFDRNRLLKTLLCYVEEFEGNQRYRLGLKKSGMRAVENLLQARFELFVQVYYHKTNRAISLMLDTIGEDCLKQGVDLWDDTSLSGITRRYTELSDEQFLRILCGKTGQAVPTSVMKLAQRVVDRQLWKRVVDCEYKDSPKETKAQAERELAILQEEFPDAPLRVDSAGPQATKGLEQGARLLSRRPNGVYSLNPSGSWETASPIFEVLAKRDRAIARVYLCQSDETLASKMRFKYPD